VNARFDSAASPSASSGRGALAAHRRRVRLQLQVGTALLGLSGVGWGAFFLLRGYHGIAAVDALMCALALAIHLQTRREHLRAAGLLLVLGLGTLLIGMALLLDVPSAAAPRSVHLYLLVLAICASLVFAREHWALRHGVTLACLAAFLVLASLPDDWPGPALLPDSIRVPGTWVNAIVASGLIYACLQILQIDSVERSTAMLDLKAGLAAGQFELFLQPQVDAAGRVRGAEALLRWRHPQRGLVAPGEFIAEAEASGLIHALGAWVLEAACRQLSAWQQDSQLSRLSLSINVSAHEFRRAGYAEAVLAAVAAAHLPQQRLKLELTESVLVDDFDDVATKARRLREAGIGLSLDDFGTGYASLTYLRRLPLDQLKIDQSFVRDVLADAGDAAIARTIIGLGESLGLSVIAEGVEHEAQRRFLVEAGCTLFQGYLFSRPLPVAAFEAYVRAAAGR
jgi:EAL domain-containing protein (putative c-di-GMP-specific phosphodiesterase class I)/uncharacterized membrane protein YhdT